ncbi:MarR family winged helix-turn-helix transcriptional regulator [Streptomyces griseorubiginosus]|uniref:MarR family winged helix-turn-helix transcriptional regulator n=1 Tax=Streptomyces griseorubiginosus TaxID=67304 RepID=UPI001AD745C2|nr:MarR family transcriptional regulator [Streptomyces griseorubiginosus]MBO4259225.1 MarR family transcriptional regulator [Streptomyces griseorubiginosus]
MEKTRWLDDEEQRAWRAYCNASALLEDTLDQQLRSTLGVPQLYYAVMVRLSEMPDRRLRMTAIAEELKVSRSRLTHMIRRLEEEGWVRREDCPSDKRSQFAVMTDEGMAALEKTAPGHVSTVRAAVFDHLTAEQTRHFAEVCETILAALTDPDGPVTTGLPWRR